MLVCLTIYSPLPACLQVLPSDHFGLLLQLRLVRRR